LSLIHVVNTSTLPVLLESGNVIRVFLPLENKKTRMWANAQRDTRPAEYRWRPLFNAATFG